MQLGEEMKKNQKKPLEEREKNWRRKREDEWKKKPNIRMGPHVWGKNQIQTKK